jgi:putative exosortase-associated protein (TIGR04073 family)
MRSITCFLPLILGATLVGCAGPEEKLGRGLVNVTEFARGGQMRRSIEQTALWDGPDYAYTTGVFRGFNRSVARTVVGVFEVATFPLPPYGPVLTSKTEVFPDASVATLKYPYGGLVLTPEPPYPANFRPGITADSMFATDTALGFSGGEVAPIVPGSRFRVFDD